MINKFKVTGGKSFSLKDFDTADTAGFEKDEAEELLEKLTKHIAGLQEKLYAENKYAVLIIFQAMDAAGKDSAIAHTMSGINPQGCQVFSFKQPTAEDYEHDFLWRHYKALPERGRIGIHNRSHYENVLITKVHPEMILKEKLPGYDKVKKLDKKFWNDRYDSIRDFEKHLTRNGTVVIKFFLNVSKEEQKERFLKRIDDETKNWKFSAQDMKERDCWDDYMKAYEKAFEETATDDCPWYILPADKKWVTRLAISHILLETLRGLKLKFPEVPKEEKKQMSGIEEKLES